MLKKLIIVLFVFIQTCCFSQDTLFKKPDVSLDFRIDAGIINTKGVIFYSKPWMDISSVIKINDFYFGLGLFEYKLRKLHAFKPLGPLDEFIGDKSFWLIYLETPIAYDFGKFLNFKKSNLYFEICPQYLIAGRAIWMNIFDPSYPNTNLVKYKDFPNYNAFDPKFNLKTSIRYTYELTNWLSIGAFIYFQMFKIAPDFYAESWSLFGKPANYKQNRDSRIGLSISFKLNK